MDYPEMTEQEQYNALSIAAQGNVTEDAWVTGEWFLDVSDTLADLHAGGFEIVRRTDV